jgi:hypothetical protein
MIIVPVSVPTAPAPALWMAMMLVFVLPPFIYYVSSGDILKKKVDMAFGVVVVVGIALMPVSYWLLS